MINSLLSEFLLIALLLLLITAVIIDIKYHRIPNLLCISFIIVGMTMQSNLAGWEGVLTSISGMLCGLVLFLPLYIFKGMGAGDVKMMAALGAILGPFNTLIAAGFTLILGGILAILLVLYRTISQQKWHSLKAQINNYLTTLKLLIYTRKYYPPSDSKATTALRFPYALAISGGAFIVLTQQSIFSFIHLKSLLINQLGITIGGLL